MKLLTFKLNHPSTRLVIFYIFRMCFDNSQRNECKLVAWITHVDEESESGVGFIVVLLSQTAAAPVASLL